MFSRNFHSSISILSTLWSLRNFCITWKLFREINFLVNCLLRKLFSRKFFRKLWYKNFVKSRVCCHSVEIWTFSPTILLQKLRQSNFFTKELYCKLISRKKIQVGVNFRDYHTVLCGNYGILSPFFLKKLREINFPHKNFILNWFDEKKEKQPIFFSFIFVDLEITQYPRVFIPCIYLHTWASI